MIDRWAGQMDQLRDLRRRVVRRELTVAQAAEEIGIPRGTLCSRWRITGIYQESPMGALTPTAGRVLALVAESPELSDDGIAARLGICRSAARKHRVRLGIAASAERMKAIDQSWRRRKPPTDAQFRTARDEVVARRKTVKEAARSLGISQAWIYRHWHRLGLIGGKTPRGGLAGSRRKSRPCPVRDEVQAHLLAYSWMLPHDIANSMTADGYPISVRAVELHLEAIRRSGESKG